MVTKLQRGLVSILVCCAAAVSFCQTRGGRSIFLLAGENGGWCAFKNERTWASAKASMDTVPDVAKVDYLNGQVTFVYVTTADETGDWTIYDKYVFDKNGQPTRLERTINITDQMREEQTWAIRNNKAVKERSVGRSLSTHAVIPEGKIWLPDLPVITRAREFPFWTLATERTTELLSKGRICEPQKE